MKKYFINFNNHIRQYGLRYIVVGVWNTAFGMVFYTSLLLICGQKYYLILGIISHAIAVTNAFLCYKYFVFKSNGNFLKEYFKCHLVYAGSMLLGTIEMYTAVSLLNINAIIANAAITLINIVVSFTGHKYFSFSSELSKRIHLEKTGK